MLEIYEKPRFEPVAKVLSLSPTFIRSSKNDTWNPLIHIVPTDTKEQCRLDTNRAVFRSLVLSSHIAVIVIQYCFDIAPLLGSHRSSERKIPQYCRKPRTKTNFTSCLTMLRKQSTSAPHYNVLQRKNNMILSTMTAEIFFSFHISSPNTNSKRFILIFLCGTWMWIWSQK